MSVQVFKEHDYMHTSKINGLASVYIVYSDRLNANVIIHSRY
jgi:hypothetical protein